jgi:hypothetical protein
MAEFKGIKCDQCPAHDSDPKDWLVAIERPGLDGVIYESLASLSEDIPAEYAVRHLCCDQCARIDFNLWLDRHKLINLQRKAEA